MSRVGRWPIVLFAIVLVSGCTTTPARLAEPTATPPTRPTDTLAPEATATPEPTAVPAPTVAKELPPELAAAMQSVLAACDTDSQAAAMQSRHVPDWSRLELSACYDMTLDLQSADGAYTGTSRVVFPNRTGDDLTELVFRVYPNSEVMFGGELRVTAARLRGEEVRPEVFLDDETAIRLAFAEPLPFGDTVEIEFEFEGRAPADFRDSPDVAGIFNFDSERQSLTLAAWYPILAVWRDGAWQASEVLSVGGAVVSEVALYRVVITAPAAWQLVSTGSTLEVEASGETELHRIVSGPVREFVLVASPTLELQEATADGVLVRHWGLPDGEALWDAVIERTVNSLALFGDRFGPYPYTELDVVAIPMQVFRGIEYPGLFLLRSTLYKPDEADLFFMSILVSHETAHEWWYGVVGSDVVNNPWQAEALAHFSSLLYQEEHEPQDFRGTLAFYEQTSDEHADVSIAQPTSAFVDQPDDFTPVVYLRGSILFHELREELEDEEFFGALRDYYSTNMYGLVSPDALLSAFEDRCACDLTGIYSEFGVRSP